MGYLREEAAEELRTAEQQSEDEARRKKGDVFQRRFRLDGQMLDMEKGQEEKALKWKVLVGSEGSWWRGREVDGRGHSDAGQEHR